PDSFDPPLRLAINRVYRILKRDAARLRGGPLLLSMRQQLYRTVSEVVTAAWSDDKPGDLNLRLPFGIIPGGWVLPRSMTYRLEKEAAAILAPADPSHAQMALLQAEEPAHPPGPLKQDEAG